MAGCFFNTFAMMEKIRAPKVGSDTWSDRQPIAPVLAGWTLGKKHKKTWHFQQGWRSITNLYSCLIQKLLYYIYTNIYYISIVKGSITTKVVEISILFYFYPMIQLCKSRLNVDSADPSFNVSPAPTSFMGWKHIYRSPFPLVFVAIYHL